MKSFQALRNTRTIDIVYQAKVGLVAWIVQLPGIQTHVENVSSTMSRFGGL